MSCRNESSFRESVFVPPVIPDVMPILSYFNSIWVFFSFFFLILFLDVVVDWTAADPVSDVWSTFFFFLVDLFVPGSDSSWTGSHVGRTGRLFICWPSSKQIVLSVPWLSARLLGSWSYNRPWLIVSSGLGRLYRDSPVVLYNPVQRLLWTPLVIFPAHRRPAVSAASWRTRRPPNRPLFLTCNLMKCWDHFLSNALRWQREISIHPFLIPPDFSL